MGNFVEDSVCMGKKMDGRPCGRPVQSGQLFCRGHRSQIAELEKIQCPKRCGELSYSTFGEIGYYECRKCKGSLLNAKNIGSILRDDSDKVESLVKLLDRGKPCDLDCPTCEIQMLKILVRYEIPAGGRGFNLGSSFAGAGAGGLLIGLAIVGAASASQSALNEPSIRPLVLDGCKSCGSFWFDDGEAQSIRHYQLTEKSPKKRQSEKGGNNQKPTRCTFIDPTTSRKCNTLSFRGTAFCWKHK